MPAATMYSTGSINAHAGSDTHEDSEHGEDGHTHLVHINDDAEVEGTIITM